MTEVIDNHSVRTDLLTSGGHTLDAGARGFRFARRMLELGQSVVSMDPDPEVEDPKLTGLLHRRVALVDGRYPENFLMLHLLPDREARHLGTGSHRYIGVEQIQVRVEDIGEVMKATEVRYWDCVKLNIEGSEYGVLARWPGPIARQIVVSFHEHTSAAHGDSRIGAIVEHLSQWYVPVQHVKDARYCAGLNYWDSLFVLKELA